MKASPIRGKRVLLGVTGGIAAYKCAYLVRELVRSGAEVRVVMTQAATEFVAPLTFSALTRYPVATDLWAKDQSTDSDIGTRHIDLATWCDIMVVAPASANTLAKLAHGLADNLVTVLALACRRPILLAPTMDADMFINEATQRHIARLYERGFGVIRPDDGEHASGLKGPGRLPEVESLVAEIGRTLKSGRGDLHGKTVLVTAGPTEEAIDPVRFIGNRSSGKMGFAIAAEAARRGADVVLIAGPVRRETPRTVRRVDVRSAAEMLKAVRKEVRKADITVMAAAVADYAPSKPSAQKIKKSGPGMTLELRKTPDILAEVRPLRKKGSRTVGFALETADGMKHAREKLKSKGLDMIVLNMLSASNDVFGSDRNAVTFIDRKGTSTAMKAMEKTDVARALFDYLTKMR